MTSVLADANVNVIDMLNKSRESVAYNLVDLASEPTQALVDSISSIDSEPGFKVLPRRWVVERTFGWLTRWRRLVRDYEQRLDVSEAMIHVAMGSLLLRRISH